jgi:hypothetical protein
MRDLRCVLVISITILEIAATCKLRADGTQISPSEITTLHSQLGSSDPVSFGTALARLESCHEIPNELVGDVLALYIRLAPTDTTPPQQPKTPEELKALQDRLRQDMQLILLFGAMDKLWEKMDSKVLARELSPYLHDPKTVRTVIEIPSHNEAVAKALLPDLANALDHPNDPDIVYWVAKALTPLGHEADISVPNFMTALSNKNDKFREDASRALVAIGVTDKQYLPVLIRGLGDPDIVVDESCDTLVSKMDFNPGSQVPALLDDLNNGFNDTVIELLQKVGPSIIQPLCDHAARSTPDSLDTHIMVLRKFGPQSARALSADLHSTNPNLRYLAIDLAAEFPDASQKSVDWLTPYLVDPDKNIRILALTNWVHKQTDARQRVGLLSKDITDPDLQETAINLAAELKGEASPLLPAIHAAIDKADEKTKIEYMGDALDIDPKDDKTYAGLISYLVVP